MPWGAGLPDRDELPPDDPLAALLCRLMDMPLARMRTLDIRTGSLSMVRRMPWGGDAVEAVNSGIPLT